ncbi:MAG: DUF1385 domain-containing protein [Candidatus Eisenbacteria bacterium]|nr:DUF1385 domain-containing protein [Candidatus Eisenbacteria bacterium]
MAGQPAGVASGSSEHPAGAPVVHQDYDSPISGFGEQPAKGGKIHYGGQAVIEGVMMRGPEKVATAVRMPDGEIAIHVEEFIPATRKHRLLRLPVVRGGATLIESLMLGIRALNYSASVAMEEAVSEGNGEAAEPAASPAEPATPPAEPAPREPRRVPPPREASDWKTKAALTGTMVFAFALGIIFFFWIPLVLTDFIMNTTGTKGGILFNLIDGAIRVIFFLAYIWGISLWGEMRRVFEYHGAEHKTIFMQEAGAELTPENAKKYATKHPRCGTSFLLIVMVVSILVFMIFGRPQNIGQRLFRIALIPVIAGISYEFMKLSAKYSARRWARILSGPGIWLQNITTKPPTDDQVEVAIASLKAVRVEEAPMALRPAGGPALAVATAGAGDAAGGTGSDSDIT